MSAKQASPLIGFLIISGFTVVGASVLFGVHAKLKSAEPQEGHQASWATAPTGSHRVAEVSVAVPYVAQPSHELMPRPGAKVRTLQQYYSRRAYPGAPPIIPHPVQNDGVINDACLSCHKDGGYVPEYNAYTPITPHPNMGNCRQCHVPQTTKGFFVETEWPSQTVPPRGRQVIPGGPLQIPHSLHMRTDCKACHVGPQAVVEIRSSHPERENCQQCHVPQEKEPVYHSIFDLRTDLAHAEK